MGKLLLFSSVLTVSCGAWLALMEVLLRHPGFVSRAAVASLIAAAGLSTFLVRALHLGVSIERWLWAAAAALIGLGVMSFLRNARATHFEGFVFIISIVLVLQGLLMLGTLGRPAARGHKIADA